MENKIIRKNISCYKCRDEGLPGGCPDCGLEMIGAVSMKAATPIKVKDLADLHIPTSYKSNRWNKKIVQQDNFEYFEEVVSFDRYVEQLDKSLNIISKGGLPTTSALVVSPPGFSKTTWAYSCLAECHEHGYNVVPLIDTTQLKRMMYTSSENPGWFVNYLGYHIDKFVNADFLIVTVAKGPEYVYAFEVIVNILDVRGRLDKPTIILSDYPIEVLCVEDKYGAMKNLIRRRMQEASSSSVDGSARSMLNHYRYPSVIEFSVLKGVGFGEDS